MWSEVWRYVKKETEKEEARVKHMELEIPPDAKTPEELFEEILERLGNTTDADKNRF